MKKEKDPAVQRLPGNQKDCSASASQPAQRSDSLSLVLAALVKMAAKNPEHPRIIGNALDKQYVKHKGKKSDD